MRIGFVHGVLGDPLRLQRALALLEGCDRIVSMGDWLGPTPPAPACTAPLLDGDPRFLFLLGAEERRWSKARATPMPLRSALQRLPSVSLEHGVAVVGRSLGRGRADRSALRRLVAPFAVYARSGASRLWREVGGLIRVEEVPEEPVRVLDGGRWRLDLGQDGPACAVLDLEAGTLRVVGAGHASGGSRRQRRRVSRARVPEQIRLAV